MTYLRLLANVQAEPVFGVLDLSLAFGEEGSLASCAAKQIAEPTLADETKLGRAAILAMLIHDQPPLLAVARGRPCRRGE